jgi:hypothetical protein
MADAIEKPKLLLIAEHFQQHGVEFMVIGGHAAVLHGSPPCERGSEGEARMHPEELFLAARRQPFEPFRLCVSDGAAYDIRHPDMILPGRRAAVIGLPHDPAQPYERFVTVALLHVTQLEPLDASSLPGDGQPGT